MDTGCPTFLPRRPYEGAVSNKFVGKYSEESIFFFLNTPLRIKKHILLSRW